MFRITWLGQAGLLFEDKDKDLTIMIDPYLSNSVIKVNPNNYRRVPINEKFFEIRPDVMIFTHDHLDHLDYETAEKFLENEEKSIIVMASAQGYQNIVGKKHGHNYLRMIPGTEWTEKGVRFTAITAVHSEPTAIGIIIDDGEKKYYITGDTLYNEKIFVELPQDIDVLFLPINGVGNNMNVTDARRFADKVGAKVTVPMHVGMFDENSPEMFDYSSMVVPKLYEEMDL